MRGGYVLRPKAVQDLEAQAEYLATRVSSKIGHRFLFAAHETFALLAREPGVGWLSKLKNPHLSQMRIFRVSGFERMLVLYFPRSEGIEILRVLHGFRNLEALMNDEGVE